MRGGAPERTRRPHETLCPGRRVAKSLNLAGARGLNDPTMTPSSLALACAVLLGAEAPATSPGPGGPLPRSSIAAVLAHRGDLGLTDAEVSELEKRDEALQKQVAKIREEFPGSSHGSGGPGGTGAGPSPMAAPPEGGGGGHHGGGGGGRHHDGSGGSSGRQDSAGRGAVLRSRLDDADTTAWLAAETVIAESRREKARDVAERYREALADRREAERAAKGR